MRKSGLPQEIRPGLFKRIYYYFTQQPVSTVDRIISFDQSVYPQNKFENIIRNQKYSVYTFVFVVLFNQFKFFFNFFFLVIALSQFIEQLKVGKEFSLFQTHQKRFPFHLYRSFGVCPHSYYGQRSI